MALTDNLISYWKLDGNSTDSVGSNNGSDTGITYSVGNGKINQGAGFNGTTSKIEGSSITISSSASISCWFKTSSTPSNANPQLFGFINGAAQRLIFFISDGTGKINCWWRDNNGNMASIQTSGNYNDGNWHFLVATATSGSPSTLILYIDGSAYGSPSTATFTGVFTGCVMRMGTFSGTSEYYTGAVDECGYWSRALSSTEVTQLYNGGNGNQYPFTFIKTIGGLTKASVKTLGGLAIGSVKSIGGLQ